MIFYRPPQLVTYLGEAVVPLEGESPEALSLRVQEAVETLIKAHQRLPGNILAGILDRLRPCQRG